MIGVDATTAVCWRRRSCTMIGVWPWPKPCLHARTYLLHDHTQSAVIYRFGYTYSVGSSSPAHCCQGSGRASARVHKRRRTRHVARGAPGAVDVGGHILGAVRLDDPVERGEVQPARRDVRRKQDGAAARLRAKGSQFSVGGLQPCALTRNCNRWCTDTYTAATKSMHGAACNWAVGRHVWAVLIQGSLVKRFISPSSPLKVAGALCLFHNLGRTGREDELKAARCQHTLARAQAGGPARGAPG